MTGNPSGVGQSGFSLLPPRILNQHQIRGSPRTKRIPSETFHALIHNDYKYDNLVLDWEMCTALAYWADPQDPEELQRIRWGLQHSLAL